MHNTISTLYLTTTEQENDFTSLIISDRHRSRIPSTDCPRLAYLIAADSHCFYPSSKTLDASNNQRASVVRRQSSPSTLFTTTIRSDSTVTPSCATSIDFFFSIRLTREASRPPLKQAPIDCCVDRKFPLSTRAARRVLGLPASRTSQVSTSNWLRRLQTPLTKAAAIGRVETMMRRRRGTRSIRK